MRRYLLALLIGGMSVPGLLAQSTQPTGLVVGQVVDATTGKPVSEALVDLQPANAPASTTSTTGTPRVRVITDGDGRFFFSGLPAGEYGFTAAKPGYLPSRGIARRPLGVPTRLDLKEGQRVVDLKLPIWKYATLSGLVLDEAGEPVVGVEVRALRRTFVSGRPRLASAAAATGTTDDRGVYRLTTLTPGDYVVVVPSTQTTFPVSALADFGQTSMNSDPRRMAEMFNAIREISPPGSSRNQTIGDFHLLTLNRAPLPPAPAETGAMNVYLTVFYPSTLSVSEASAVSIAAGEERSGVNLQLEPVAAVRVSGKLISPNGPLAQTAVRLLPAVLGETTNESGLEAVTGLTDANGAFTLLGVPTGQYLLKVLTPAISANAPSLPSTPDKPVWWATEAVTVGDTNLGDVNITVRPALRVMGRLDFRGTKEVKPAEIDGLYVNLDSATGGQNVATSADGKGEFAMGAPGGKYNVRAEAPTGWRVKSILFDGKDAADRAVQVKGDSELVFVLSDQPAMLTGTVREARGTPDVNALVAIFPVNRQLWLDYGLAGWRVRSTSSTLTGAFTFQDLIAGEYFVAVVPDAIADTWNDPKTLEMLSRTAMRVTIDDGDRKSVDLTTPGPIR